MLSERTTLSTSCRQRRRNSPRLTIDTESRKVSKQLISLSDAQRTTSIVSARAFHRYIGVDLGGGKGKNTAVAVLRPNGRSGATVERLAPRLGDLPLYDGRLVELIQSYKDGPTVVA